MIVGTAGHVDHGKTALVRALTGVDTDRLPEEKRRGITIELGFAPLALPGGITAAVVDVPGHEAFVRTMVAGAAGVDVALLVVAADEGVMPQTREHLAILGILGVRRGVVALTKRDLVDDEWLALVEDDVRAAVAGTSLADAAIVAVSALRGEGVDELRDALAIAAAGVGERDARELFRMPVDRSFTVRGTGTVVTGTVWNGSVAREAAVRVMPADRPARVRGLQAHGAPADRVGPATRAAVALHGVELADVGRGHTLVTDPRWRAASVLRADVELLGGAPSLGPRTRVRFHLGTADVGARIVGVGGALGAGDRRGVRVVLDEPVVAAAGDRFVLRRSSPSETIGGGAVTDAAAPSRRARPWTSGATHADRVRLALAEAGARGLATAELAIRLGASAEDAGTAVAGGVAVAIGERLYSTPVWLDVRERLAAMVAAAHQVAPLEPGVSAQWVRAQLAGAGALADAAVRAAVRDGTLVADGALLAVPGWSPSLSVAQAAVREAIVSELASAGREPPSVPELAARHGDATVALLRLLERERAVVAVDAERYWAAGVLDELVRCLRNVLEPGRVYGPSELRDVVGVSRKYLIPLLEYLDRAGVTERRGEGRVIRATGGAGTPFAKDGGAFS